MQMVSENYLERKYAKLNLTDLDLVKAILTFVFDNPHTTVEERREHFSAYSTGDYVRAMRYILKLKPSEARRIYNTHNEKEA